MASAETSTANWKAQFLQADRQGLEAAAPRGPSSRELELEAIIAWVKSRPPAATEHLLLWMPRAGAPGPLGSRDIARIVGRHRASGR